MFTMGCTVDSKNPGPHLQLTLLVQLAFIVLYVQAVIIGCCYEGFGFSSNVWLHGKMLGPK